MATTEDAIVDRARAVLEALDFTEAVNVTDFALQPVGASDQAYLVRYVGNQSVGQIGYREEARGTLTVQVTRAINGAAQTAQRLLLQDARRILAGLVNDGHVVSGEYAIDDAARTVEITAPKGASYLVMTLRVSLNFDALLTA